MLIRQFPLQVIWLRAAILVLCFGVAPCAARINRVQDLENFNASLQEEWIAPYTPPPVYPPSDAIGQTGVGSINIRDALNTEDIVKNGVKEGMDMAADDITQWKCDKFITYMDKLQKRYKKLKFNANYQQYSGAKMNARRVEPNDVVDKPELVKDKIFKADKLSEELHLIVMETLRVTEQFGLKCGASDEGCFDFGTELIANFKQLIPMKQEAEGLLLEAGWVEGEIQMDRLATQEMKDDAKMRKDLAFHKAEELWKFESLVTAQVMIKAAACGTRPPMGPWSTPSDGCNLKPEDPIMKALLTDDPAEFVRRWKKEIAKVAGIEEEFVHVDISSCLGVHGRPTLPPGWKA